MVYDVDGFHQHFSTHQDFLVLPGVIFLFCFCFFPSKRTLLLNNIPAVIGSLMMFSSYYAKGPALLIIGRLVFGFNNGT